MPLRQSLLSFAAAFASPKKTDSQSQARPKMARQDSATSSSSSDVIEVMATEPPVQLPTPSDTATEASSVSSRQDTSKKMSRRDTKRLSRGKSRPSLAQSPQKGQAQDRTVSGETLVNSASASQDSLVKSGIDKLNLPWNMSDVFAKGSKADLLETTAEDDASSQKGKVAAGQDSEEEGEEDSEDDEERAARAAAKKAKMAENNKLWEKRRKAAAKNATRKSSRASMLTKVGDFAESVLEKRASRVNELKSLVRSRSASDAQILDNAVDGPDAKKRRVSSGATLTSSESAPVLSSKKPQRAPKDKKWLISGLYAGQQRSFDARHHGGSNKKRKSEAADSDEKKENTTLPLPMFLGERLLKEGRDFKLPFDVFSPLPPGQPKPDEWRKSNKNLFVGDAAAEWRVTKPMEYSACLCKAETGCDADCMNRYMYYECDDKNCNLTAEQCGNRAFDDLRKRAKKGGKYNIGVEVIKTVDRGHGVRSNRTFEPDQIIVEYSGEIINQDECDRRMKKEYKSNEVSMFVPVSSCYTNIYSATI
jgi:[histone H3]-lysine4 N-trimethyltransferase ASH1L